MVQVVCLSVGELGTNCYLVYDKEGGAGTIVDPGGDVHTILSTIERYRVSIEKIVLTHGHADHLAAADEFRQKSGAEVYIHQADAEMAANKSLNLSTWIMPVGFSLEVDQLLQDGQIISMAGENFRVIHTPGHTGGSICLYCVSSELLFSGDTLFCGAVGRTDLPGGSPDQLRVSVEKLLAELPGTTKVYPGHGAITTIQAEHEAVLREF